MRKILLASGLFTIILVGSASAALFSDTENSRYEGSIHLLTNAGILRGYDDGTFRPDAPVNRAELMKILMSTAYPNTADPSDLRCFDDFTQGILSWYARSVCLAKGFGIVHGYPDGTFRPANTVNFVEALKMAALTFGSPLSPPTGGETWYAPYIELARKNGVLLHLLNSPSHLLTRGEVAELIVKMAPEGLLTSSSSSVSSPRSSVCGNAVKEGEEECDDGNTEDGDGCSSICLLVSEPIRHATLGIQQQASTTVATFPSGRTDVPLLRFTAVSGRQDALLTKIAFVPEIGSLLYAQKYTLAMDRDGNGTYETIAQESGKTDGGRLVFDQLGAAGLLHDGLIVPFEVRANIVNTIANVSLKLKLNTTTTDYIEATGAQDGRSLTGIETDGVCPANQICWISVLTQTSGTIDISERGNLFVLNDNAAIRPHIVLGSSLSDPVFKVKLLADQEDIDIADLRFEGGSQNIESLYLYRNGEQSAFAQATNSQCGTVSSARFCADLPSRTWIIKRNEEATLVVRAKIKSDQLGAVSGESFTISLSTSTTSYPAIEAHGMTSNSALAQNDGDTILEGEIFIGRSSPSSNVPVAASSQTVALAKIASVQRGTMESDGGIVPSGMSTLGMVEIQASPHLNTWFGSNNVQLKTLTFQVLAQNVQIDPLSPKLFTQGNPSASASCSASAPTGTITITCSNIDGSLIQYLIGQGQKVTYILQANITNPQIAIAPSLLITSLPVLGNASTTNSIIWSDEASVFSWVDTDSNALELLRYRRG